MSRRKNFNPYGDNILIKDLGPILDRDQVYKRLLTVPSVPTEITRARKLERLHHLMSSLLDLHIPSLESVRIYETIDLHLRQSYRYRDPATAKAWQQINGEPNIAFNHRSPAMASAVVGNSGTGKTETILRTLEMYPHQVITHKKFPNLVGQHHQVAWLSVDAPSSGKSADLAENLMIAWDNLLEQNVPNYIPRFTDSLARTKRDGLRMLNEWRQVALTGWLGFLHMDEVQNYFKLATLKQRRNNQRDEKPSELSIVEDQCLKWILSFLNTAQIPVMFSGTLDGIGALTKRLSTTQRISTGGYHKLLTFTSSNLNAWEIFFETLLNYQYVKHPISDPEQLSKLILELTAGVPRIIIALWFAAHRVAFERREDSLKLEDFEKASNTLMAPLKPAIAALNSGDPEKMSRFDDLLPRDDGVWSSFWLP